MNRRVLGVFLLAVFVVRAERAWAQKYLIDDPVPPDAKGLVLSMSGEVRTIQGLASQVTGRTEPLAAALSDLGARTTETEIRIAMSVCQDNPLGLRRRVNISPFLDFGWITHRSLRCGSPASVGFRARLLSYVRMEAVLTPSASIFKSTSEQKAEFWRSFLRAAETEPVEAKPVRGVSGLFHPVVATGVDRKRRRLVIVSGDPDARSAALGQADIQAAYTDYRVIVARPITVKLSRVAEYVVGILGAAVIGPKQVGELSRKRHRRKTIDAGTARFLDQALLPAFRGFEWASVDVVAAWQDVIMQLSHLVIEQPTSSGGLEGSAPSIRLGPLVALDPAEVDRQMGNCVVPLTI